MKRIASFAFVVLVLLAGSSALLAQQNSAHVLSPEERAIVDQLRVIRKVPDTDRGNVTRDLALKIRALPAGPDKFELAIGG